MTENKLHTDNDQKSFLGFWIYLMTDCLLFATLFAAFAVLRNNTFGGPTIRDIVHPSYVLVQTLLLLTSSFTCSLAVASSIKKSASSAIRWLFATIVLGASFFVMEFLEFRQLSIEGHSWRVSAALSSFFTLVGTHGLHIAIGLLWSLVLLWLIVKHGITKSTERKLRMFSMYWHFLDVVWICVFTEVYLRGVM
jgi:cytochrome o ubiquinol oxidase subunit 3